MSEIKLKFFNFQNTCLAYLFAVTSASLAFTLALEEVALVSNGGFETSTANDFPTKALHISAMTVLLFLIGWLFAFFMAVIPFAIGIAVAIRLAIIHWSFFVVGAIFTAIGIVPILISIPNLGINMQGLEPSFYLQFFSSLPIFVFSGAVAGIACFGLLRRQVLAAKAKLD